MDYIKVGLIIVSDHVYLCRSLDKVKNYVKRLLSKYNFMLCKIAYCPNDIDYIRKEFYKMYDDVNIVLVAGGTGISGKDVSIEAFKPLMTKTLEGFGEFVRRKSEETVGSKSHLSRACAGIVGNKLVIIVPAKKDALEIAVKDFLLKEAKHIIEMLKGISHWAINVIKVERPEDFKDLKLILRLILPHEVDGDFLIARISRGNISETLLKTLQDKVYNFKIVESKSSCLIFLCFKPDNTIDVLRGIIRVLSSSEQP